MPLNARNSQPMPASSPVWRDTGTKLGFNYSNFNSLTPTSVHVSPPAGRNGAPAVTTGSPVEALLTRRSPGDRRARCAGKAHLWALLRPDAVIQRHPGAWWEAAAVERSEVGVIDNDGRISQH